MENKPNPPREIKQLKVMELKKNMAKGAGPKRGWSQQSPMTSCLMQAAN